jgi:hypothetical protein
MKKLLYTITVIAGFSLLGLTGCTKEGGVDTAKVESAFQTAAAVDKTAVQNAVTAVKAGDYTSALASLQKVAASVNLTPEQKTALTDFINEVKAKLGAEAKSKVDDATKAVGDASNAAKEGASKAVDGLKKSLGK